MESLTRLMNHHHRKKHSTASSSSNGMALSDKEDYKQLFNGDNKKTKFRRGGVAEDYDEIFGGGVGSGRGSSISVLDLSDIERTNGSGEFRGSNVGYLDYPRIFGGGAGGGLPPFEELFGGAHKSKSDKAKPRVTADLGSSMTESDKVIEYGLGRGCLPQVSNQSFDGAKQLNVSYHKTSQRGKHDSNGTTHIAQLNAVSGFTCFVNGDTHLQNQDHDKGILPKETATNDKMNTRDELSNGKSGRKAKWGLQNAQYASEGTVNGKDNVDRNLTGLNRRLFHSGEIDVESLKVPPPSSSSIDQSRPNSKLFYSGELDLKSRPSKAPPPAGSLAQHNDNKMHLNQSKSFAFGSKVDSPKKDDTGGYFSPSDEELDVDSAAAVSAAALKNAIQQAQESIRLAKEIMERKHNRMKTRSRSALKVKDVKETIHDQHVISVAEKNIDDACNVLETKVQAQTEYDPNKAGGNVEDNISAVKEKETFPVNRSGEAQRPEEHAETVGGGGMSLWFTQLLNNGKNKMSALASQLVDNKNNTILPEKSEKIVEANMTKEAVTLETNNSEKMDSVAGVLLPKAAQRELSTFHRETYSDMNVDISGTNVFVKDANLNAQVHDKFEGEKSEKKLDWQDIKDDRKLESEKCEKDCPAKKIICLVESTDEAKMVFKLEKEEVLDTIFGLEENGSRIDAVDGRKLGEFSQEVDDEGQSKAANGKEIFEKLEDLAEVRLECNSQHKTDEQRPIHSHDGAGNQILLQEACFQKEFNPRTINKRQYESKDLGHRDVIVGIQQKEIDVSKTGSWPVDANKNHLNSSFDSCDSDNINMPSENVELCGLSMDFCNEQVCQPEDRSSVKDNNLTEDEEQACELVEGNSIAQNDDVEFEEDEYEVEQEAEGTFWLEESEFCDTSYLNEGRGGDFLDTIGRNPESDDLECEEDKEQVEQAVEDAIRLMKSESLETLYLDGNNEEGDVQQTNEAIDDLEREVDEEEVEEAVEGAFRLKQNEKHKTYQLDQSSVQGDVLETIVQCVSEAQISGDKTDSFGSATTTHEEIICEGELPTDVDNDSDKDKSPPEMSPSTFGFSDMKVKIQIKKEDDHSNFPVDPENITVVLENEVCMGNIMEDVNDAPEKEAEMDNKVEDHQERDLVEKHEEPNLPMHNNCEGCQKHLEPDSLLKTGQSTECCEESLNSTERESIETREAAQKETEINGYKNDYLRKIELVKRERERQKDRIAVERAIREARERAFAEARERAERALVERANADARQRAISEAREKFGKVASGTKISKDKASSESKLKAERSAVERATAEARERALEKAMSQKSTSEARAPVRKVGAGISPSVSTNTGLKHSVSSPNLEGSGESNTESAQRRKARLDRHQRIMERAEKALAEKNMRDILAQREQAERKRLAETLDAEIKRWASGKEGNLRALLSTLQYILGTKNGWQPITLTEIITTSAVKKAYRKATLHVHPDKLQQRGASIRQKYICEKVFYLLQVTARWHPDEACRPDLEQVPVFYPTEEEFEDTLKYIASMRSKAEVYGISRIVPPHSWKPPCLLKQKQIWENSKFSTRIQRIDKLQNRNSVRKVYADHFKSQYFMNQHGALDPRVVPSVEDGALDPRVVPSVEDIEGEYWRVVLRPTEEIEVLYGADLETGVFGSGFPKNLHRDVSDSKYTSSGWNLNF